MPFDRAAHRRQAARIVQHTAGGEVLLRWNGAGEAFPATIAAEKPTATRAQPDVGRKAFELVSIAREARGPRGALVFAAKQPREGQTFTDASGRIYRIMEDRTVSHGSLLVYACAASAS